MGREREYREICARLRSERLVTLTGPGGIGKTRLAIRVAEVMAEELRDGSWHVDLASLADASLVPRAVARVVGVVEASDRSLMESLHNAMLSQEILLVLDNCEHLIDACATLAEALLAHCPGLRILATSRQPLGPSGELVWRVPSLSLPEPAAEAELQRTPDRLLGFEAIRLFVGRAAAASTFTLRESNAAATVRVCRRLDGIPLAIELAAARLQALSIEQIAARLDDRFRLLTGGRRTALPRQQTLRATLDWSHELLSEPERMLLRRLSVFNGGWTLEAAEAVCSGVQAFGRSGVQADDQGPPTDNGLPSEMPERLNARMPERLNALSPDDVLDLLTALVDRSLVVVGPQGGETRYGLLETTREYAREKLGEAGETDAWRERHAQFFLSQAERAEPEMRGAAQAEWLQRLEAEHDNFRQAHDHYLRHGPLEAGLRLGVALHSFRWIRGYLSEGRERLQALLAQSGYERGDALTGGPSRPPEMIPVLAKALNCAGILADEQSDYVAAGELFQESLALARSVDDRSGVANALHHLAGLAARTRDFATARALYQESLAVWRELGERWWTATALSGLGRVELMDGCYPAARSYVERGLEIQRQLGDRRSMARSLTALGNIAARLHEDTTATALYEESLAISRELGARVTMEETLRVLGRLAHDRGDHDAALAFQEERLALTREMGNASTLADTLRDLAALAGDRGEPERAAMLWTESLNLCRSHGDEPGIAACLERRAGMAALPESARWGARLYGAAAALRERVNAPVSGRERVKYEQAVARLRATMDEAAFRAAWEAGRELPTAEAITLALRGSEAPSQ